MSGNEGDGDDPEAGEEPGPTMFVDKGHLRPGAAARPALSESERRRLGEQRTIPSHPPKSDPEANAPRPVPKHVGTIGRLPSFVVARPGAGAAPVPGPESPTLDSADELPDIAGPVGPGCVLGGKYSLVRLLGSGGMGQIYEAEHVILGIPVAIKTMHPHVATVPESRRRFFHEARAASLLKHPNVVQVLDFGEDAGLLYLVMELLRGRTLATYLREIEAPLGFVEIGSILNGVLDATATAHAHGIVHRDLKPDNVFLTPWEGKQVVKVVDFGLAHFDDQLDPGPTLTMRDMIGGTPEYMSPEQCRSLVVGPSTDLYAIGCILTVMLQGKAPFTGLPAIDLMAKHMFSLPPPLVRPPGAPPVPLLLERLRLDLLAKVPEKRPESALAVKARLLEALSEEGEARRLPARKGEVPMGDRQARAPAWEGAAPAPPVHPPEAPAERSVALLRLVPAAEGLSEACAIGLDAQGVHLVEVPDVAALAGSGLGVVVIDAGAGVEAACAQLAAIARAAPGVRAVVCASGLGAERMNALVAAGAADVARYPVTPDALGRKIARVVRRGR